MILVDIAPGHELAPDPAASALRMFHAGCPASITSSFRSRARQHELHARFLAGQGAFALPPGHSLHERGQAVDWQRPAATWIRAHPECGWRFTNPDEWWHTDYVPALDRTVGDPVPAALALAPAPAPPAPAPVTSWEDDTAMDYLKAIYLEKTGRLPDPIGAMNYLVAVATGELTWAQVAAQIESSPESAAFAALGSEQARDERRIAAAQGWVG